MKTAYVPPMEKADLRDEFNYHADLAGHLRKVAQFICVNGGSERYSHKKLAELYKETVPNVDWSEKKIQHFLAGRHSFGQIDIADIVKLLKVSLEKYQTVLSAVNEGRTALGQSPVPPLDFTKP